MENKRILITGGAGSVGSELVRQLAPKNKVYIVDINETGFFDLYEQQKLVEAPVRGRVGDIKSFYTVDMIFRNFKPELVFHAAAYKHVTPMEHDPREAIETNLIGTCNLVDAAHKYGVEKFVFISSDKAVNINSVMGASKRLGELIVRNAGFISVRFGNVLGSRGSVIPIWQHQIDKGLPVTVTSPEMERFFMTIEEAVELIIEAAEIGGKGDIIILDMGKPIKILDLAKEIIRKSGRDIPIKFIGVRPGESLNERLMYEEEESRAEKKGKFYVLKA